MYSFVFYLRGTMRTPIEITPNHVAAYHRHVIKLSSAECWGWGAAKNTGGYGVCGGYDKNRKRATNAVAHRVSYFIEHGAVPAPALMVIHLCHNPECTNPAHLRAATRRENMRTSQIVGGLQRKIPIEDLAKIALRRTMGHTLEAIGRDYGCTKQSVRHMLITHGPRLSIPIPDTRPRKIDRTRDVPVILERRARGDTLAQIAKTYGVAFQTISKVVHAHQKRASIHENVSTSERAAPS